MANLVNLKKFDYAQEGVKIAMGVRTGTRAAADFTVKLGFCPSYIRVANLTTNVSAEHFVDPSAKTGTDTTGLDAGANVKSRLQIAAGTVTYVDAGIRVNGSEFTVTVATASLETANADVVWMALG